MRDWRPALAGLVMTAGLLSACGALPAGSPSPQSPASASEADSSRPEGSCAGAVRLIASTGQTETISRERLPVFAVRVGDTLRVEATGRCGGTVRLAPGSGLDPISSGQQLTTAVEVGGTRVDLYHAMCDEHPEIEGCRGGATDDGAARIIVRR